MGADLQVINSDISKPFLMICEDPYNKYQSDIKFLSQYEKLRKSFIRAYKKKKQIFFDIAERNISDILKTHIRVESKFEELSKKSSNIEAFINYYGKIPDIKDKISYRETIEREFQHVQEDPRLLRLVPLEWDKQTQPEYVTAQHHEPHCETGEFSLEIKDADEFDLRAADEKTRYNTDLFRMWHNWQELANAYHGYDGTLSREIRCKDRPGYEDTSPFADEELYTEEELLSVIMCNETTAPGCHPREVLNWLTITPFSPAFRFADLSSNIGYRWTMNTEEWLQKHNKLIDIQEFDNLMRSSITFLENEINEVDNIILRKPKSDLEYNELPEFIPNKKNKSFTLIPGSSASEGSIANFPERKTNNGIVHHPKFYKLVICDEYPSYCYGNLDDPEELSTFKTI